MNHIKIVAAFLILSVKWVSAQDYIVSPGIPDFTDLEASCVVATTGTVDNPFARKGLVEERHTVISVQGTDAWTGGDLNLLPPGETKVVRLGNERVDREAESITYHFIVDPEKAVLLLKFAVVFQDPHHPDEAQPRFIVRIMNKEGELIEACAEYDVSARSEIDGFRTYDKAGTPVRWRDWTNVGLDMSSYAGQEVQVQFVTYDCDYQAHFGYAYFTASCVSNRLGLEACNGDRFTVTAPQGFPEYLWNDGRTSSLTQWEWKGEDMNIACHITSATGCKFTLSAYVCSDGMPLPPSPIFDTICQGEGYQRYYYNLPAQKEAGTFEYTNTFFDIGKCSKSGLVTLYLTVLQKYYPHEAAMCFGDSYTENGFEYVAPPAGRYYDTLTYNRPDRCDSVVTLALTVYPQVSIQGNITGDIHPCVGTACTYTMTEEWEEGSYIWQFPEGFQVISEQGRPEVVVQVTDAAKEGTVNLFYGTGGCAEGTIPLVVKPHLSYWPTLSDSVCSGEEYHKKGFHVPASDSAGIFTFTQYHKTAFGCDSIITLSLYNFKTPGISLLASDSVICPGESVTLQAVGDSAKYGPAPEPPVAVGDILCKSGKTVKLRDFALSGEEAVGVVFFVNKTGRHGWAVSLRDEQNAANNLWKWHDDVRYFYLDIPGLPNNLNSRLAIQDTAGYRNTQTILNVCGIQPACPAAQSVDFAGGWYLPAAGQMNQLFGVVFLVNPSLAAIGGSPLKVEMNDDERYWTSTEGIVDQAWDFIWWSGFTSANPKNMLAGVRAVRSF